MPARAHVIWVVLLDALLVTVSILKQYRDYVSVQIEGDVYICLVLSHLDWIFAKRLTSEQIHR
jgi:hypothetical protein